MHATIAQVAPDLEAIRAGYSADPRQSPDVAFVAADILSSDQAPLVQLDWAAVQELSFVTYQWRAPDGSIYRGEHGVRPQWPKTWLQLNRFIPLTRGRWTVSVFDGERLLGQAEFQMGSQN